ncbi:MAG: hypothetical protein IPJ88_04355 [Myxococcales bacterium]|nr:MAG: hypothetical protein IPJ88_04355 [Myxococcales bacterium]
MPRRIKDDQQGAIMVLGVIMAVFLVAMLYYSVGIGEAIMYREKVQDAADSAALSAAIMHARGMNLLVMFNMVMAALMAILIALKLISAVAVVGAVVLYGIYIASWGTCVFCIPGAAEMQSVKMWADNVYDSVEPAILKMIEALHCGEVAIRMTIPVISQTKVVLEVSDAYKPTAKFGVIWPIYEQLPVKDDDFNELCTRAAGYVGDIAGIPFGPLKKFVKAPISALAKTFPSYFCGASNSDDEKEEKAPSYEYTQKTSIPEIHSPAFQKCFGSLDMAKGDSPEEICTQAEEDLNSSEPVGNDAHCENELCEQRLKDARSECNPNSNKDFVGFSYVERDVIAHFRKDPTGKVYENIEDREYGSSEMVGKIVAQDSSNTEASDADNLPDKVKCPSKFANQSSYVFSPNSEVEWNADDFSEPVCKIGFEVPQAFEIPTGGEVSVSYREMQHIVGCVEEQKKTVVADAKLGSIEESNDTVSTEDGRSVSCFNDRKYARSPQRIIDNAFMGEETFQLRSIVVGKDASKEADRIVQMARWNKKDNTSAIGGIKDLIQKLSRINFAQAEYYYDDSESNGDEWLWHMHWRGRLRRFRMPDESSTEQSETAPMANDSASSCDFADSQQSLPDGSDCSEANSSELGSVDDLILH